ncbi:MAG: PKD domain-containing protein, partial [bacterium]|nr:PKD domain-containing protein [bacterium]
MIKNVCATGMCVLFVMLSFHTVRAECTGGVIAGIASADGRPIAFKNRDFDFAYQGITYESSGTYSYLGIGNSEGSYILMGLNERGVAIGNTLMYDLNGGGGDVKCMEWILNNCATVDECRNAIENELHPGGTPTSSFPLIGEKGLAYHIEKGENYYEYDPLECGPDKVRKYAITVRTNNGHMNNDGTDDETTGGRRYYEARDHLHNAVIKNGILDADPADTAGVTIGEVIQTLRWGNPGFEGDWTTTTAGNCNSTSLSTMIAHGINENEDAKIAVMWTAIYKADYIAFVPVWVVLGSQGDLSTRITKGGDAERLSYQAHRIYQEKDANDYDQYLNPRFEAMEANFIQAVSNAREHWVENGFVYEEAKAISDEAIETTYWTVKTLADQAQSTPRDLNETPLISEITTDVQSTTVNFSHDASDPDGSISTVHWDFGDDETSTEENPSHTYSAEGTYLAMCRVTDDNGSRNSIWKYVTAGGTDIVLADATSGKPTALLSSIPTSGGMTFNIQLSTADDFTLSVYNVKGRLIWEHRSQRAAADNITIPWRYAQTGHGVSSDIY